MGGKVLNTKKLYIFGLVCFSLGYFHFVLWDILNTYVSLIYHNDSSESLLGAGKSPVLLLTGLSIIIGCLVYDYMKEKSKKCNIKSNGQL